MAETDGGSILNSADRALEEKYSKIRSSIASRGLDTFKAKDLPHLSRLMNSYLSDKEDRELMGSMEYFANSI